MNIDYSNVNLLLAFAGGLITFFASCFLPLVPTYIAYLSGIITEGEENKYRLLVNSIFFALGFITIFILFGFSAAKVGNSFSEFRDIGQRAGGLVMILFGLFLIGALRPKLLQRELKLKFNVNPTRFMFVNSFVFGLSFGFAWSPCIGPLLGVIIYYASQAETAVKGSMLLFSYGLGLGIPFVLIAGLFEKIWPKIRFFIKYSEQINKIAGLLIVLAGFALLLGQTSAISLYIIRLFGIDSLTI
jgi:cytochrome c-type biogenesis protein